MPDSIKHPPFPHALRRRKTWNLAYWNIALWAAGNGLTSSTLVIYLASELHAGNLGLGVGLILAMPQLIGTLRLGAPFLIGRIAGRKTFCLGAFALSGLLLFGLPFCAAPNARLSPEISLAALLILWSLHHLMQYLGTIALFSWLADIAPRRIRGRFFGLRQRWLLAGEALGTLGSGLFSYWWINKAYPGEPHLNWIGYAIPAGVGAWLMIAAIVPLWLMPSLENGSRFQTRDRKNRRKKDSQVLLPSPVSEEGQGARAALRVQTLVKPFLDVRFISLLVFGCWFSFSNGLTQSIQFSFPKDVLSMSLFTMLAVQTAMRLGQIGVSPALGRMADRIGNKWMMLFCLVLTAQGPLFYFFSKPQNRWWFVGAWIVWIAYAGLNIGLPNLMLKLSPCAPPRATGSASASDKYSSATDSASASNTKSCATGSASASNTKSCATGSASASNTKSRATGCASVSNTPYIAAYFTVTGLCYAASTTFGGRLFDLYGKNTFALFGGTLDYSHLSFLIGWVARSLGIIALLFVIENHGRRAA